MSDKNYEAMALEMMRLGAEKDVPQEVADWAVAKAGVYATLHLAQIQAQTGYEVQLLLSRLSDVLQYPIRVTEVQR